MFVWNDAGRWCFFWWNVGKLLQVNETTSLTLESRASFTLRFSIRDRSSLRQRMTFYLCSSHLEVEILNHVDLTPRFLDASTMFFVLMVDILIHFGIRSSFQNVLTEHLSCLPSNSASNQTRKNDVTIFFSWREPHEPQEGLSLTSLVYSYIYIGPSRCNKSDEALIFESRLCKLFTPQTLAFF